MARLRGEWKKETILSRVRLWCSENDVPWNKRLEYLKREELIELFLKPTGKFGGVGLGHNLLYVNQSPLMELDKKKCEMYFRLEKSPLFAATASSGHTWMNPRKAIEQETQPGKQNKEPSAKDTHASSANKKKPKEKTNRQAKDPLMGTGHASYGGGRKKPTYPKYEGPYDPERAAELLAKKFGDKVRRLKE